MAGTASPAQDDALATETSSLRAWAINDALALWSTEGFDRDNERFEERLTLQGQRIEAVPIRLMTQARQIYSYSVAARHGWHPAAYDLVEKAFRSMVRDFHRRDGDDGWVFSIARDGRVIDATRDLYAHDFVLLAVASYVGATGDRSALTLADDTLAFIDTNLSAKVGGYYDSVPQRDNLRRQNPHMHLFEGLLSLWSCTGEQRYLARADKVFELFAASFYRAAPGVLGEYFDRALAPAAGIAVQIVEPGHHYEWVWLLRWFERASEQRVQAYVDALYGHADTFGFDDDGLIVDELLADGTPYTRSRRVWPMTEAIKANVVEAAIGRAEANRKAARLARLLQERFLDSARAGGWVDRLDEHGRVATDFMPASTLYHIVCALAELSLADSR